MRNSSVACQTDTLRIRAVRCRAPAEGRGAIEYSVAHTLVLPQSGLFVKHETPHAPMVADAAQAVFFTAGRPYRVSHPADGGDDCLVLEYQPTVLLEILNEVDPAAADTPHRPFRVGMVRLQPRAVVRRRLLWHRLLRGIAGRLEIEETALELFRAAIVAGRPNRGSRRHRRTSSRRTEAVLATQATIASRPLEPWTLAALARRAQCSPFHLAHVFGEEVGLPVHRYQLQARLTLALDGVLDTSRGLSAIAMDAGFAHHSHFTAAFRRLFGVTPSRLRRQATSAQADDLRGILTAPRTTR